MARSSAAARAEATAHGDALPVEMTRFVGRRRELVDVKRLLSASRLLTLTGMGGVGKTRLAVRAATDLKRSFRHGVCFVELADLRDPALVERSIATALGVHDQSRPWQTATLVEYLADRQVLLVLDNCEQVVDECAALAGRLLRACPDLRILATSRQPLAVAGETVLPVRSLEMPDPDHLPAAPEAMTQFDAVNLFVDRAIAAVPTFRLNDENFTAVAALVRELEGIPLALELAAVRLRALSPTEILDRLGQRQGLLTRGNRTAPFRHQTLRASMDWTFDLCSPTEQTLWRRLTVFAGGFQLDAAEAVCSDDERLPQTDVLDTVASLVDKSVVTRQELGQHVRYRMLETVREYAETRFGNAGEIDEWRRRHRDWYADFVARTHTEWIGPYQAQWLARLRLEHPNLRAALEYSLADRDQSSAGLRIAVALEHHWISHGMLSEGRRWLNRALAHPTGTSTERALALRLGAWLATLQNDTEDGTHLLKEASRLAERDNNVVVRGYVNQTSGMLAMTRGSVSSAIEQLEHAVATFRFAGDVTGEVGSLVLLGLNLGLAGELGRAAAIHQECLALTESRGESAFRSYALWALGLEAWRLGETDRAVTLEKKSLELKRELEDQLGMALCLEALAWITPTAAPDKARAPVLLGAAGAIWNTIGMSLSEVPFLSVLRAEGEASARRPMTESAFQAALRRGQELPLDQAIAFALEEDLPSGPSPDQPNDPTLLTRREQEVAELVAEGLSNREIAGRLVISPRTAEGHVEHILRKLGFTSRAQVAAWVARAVTPTAPGGRAAR